MSRAKHWVGNSNNRNKLFFAVSTLILGKSSMVTNYGSVLNDVMSEE